jgi:CheY-like chemotaxis protein
MSAENRATILVVDDNEMNREVLARRLERQGHIIVSAEDGERALQEIGKQPFDLILLDIMMPKMNGYEVLEHLKADPNQREIPVIVISALGELESVVKCIELGAEDYLFKPFNPILLKARLNSTLEKKRLRDEFKAGAQAKASPMNSDRLDHVLSSLSALSAAGSLNDEQQRLLAQIQDTIQKLKQ